MTQMTLSVWMVALGFHRALPAGSQQEAGKAENIGDQRMYENIVDQGLGERHLQNRRYGKYSEIKYNNSLGTNYVLFIK